VAAKDLLGIDEIAVREEDKLLKRYFHILLDEVYPEAPAREI
jgi:hypothetical protein